MMIKKNKYGAKRTVYNGIKFHSLKEARYCQKLDIAKKASLSKDRVITYELQVPYVIIVNESNICTYLLDFKVTYADGSVKYIDVKGVRTPIYKIKKKLVEALYSIEISEV